MNDYKELVKKLRWAATIGDAPTIGEEFGTIITRKEAMEAANAIEQLVNERDAAVADIPRSCYLCKDFDKASTGDPKCDECGRRFKCHWQWRGLEAGLWRTSN